MFNLLRMDLRRLFRNRNFYIVLGVTAGLILLVVLLAVTMADSDFLDEMAEAGAEVSEYDRRMSEEIHGMSLLEFAHEALGSGFLLIMTGIGVTLFTCSDFSSGYIKNICSITLRRRDYVLEKILLTGIYSGIITVLSVLLSVLSPVLFHMQLTANAVPDILWYTFQLWVPHWAFGLMALALVLLARSTTPGITMSLVSGGGLPAVLLGLLSGRFGWPPVEQYFLSNIVKGQCAPQVDAAGLVMACAAGWGLVYVIGSLLAMEQQDI